MSTKDLPMTRADAWSHYYHVREQAMAAGDWPRAERHLGRTDLFYLLARLLRRMDIDKPWLFERCREVQAEPDGFLDLWFREGYKSTIITFGKTIQDILINPELTVGIFSHTRPIAKGFLQQIKREFEDNDYLKDLYSDVLYANPGKEAPKWSEDGGLIVKRGGNPKEATLEAYGLVDGMPTSKHFSLRVYDDVVTRESVTSGEMVQKTTDAWDLSQNLGSVGGRMRMIGTRYCTAAGTRILMADWSHKAIEDISPGEEVIGFELRDGKRWLVSTPVLFTGLHPTQPVNRYVFSNGRSVICTPDHLWWRGAQWAGGSGKATQKAGKSNGREYSPLGFGYHDLKHIRQLLVPTEPDDSRDAGWLAGFFDGEGTIQKNVNHPSGAVVFIQSEKNGNLIERCHEALSNLGFETRTYVNDGPRDNPCHRITVNGGWRERYRFLTQVAPSRRTKLEATLFGQLMTERLKLVSIEPQPDVDVFWLETGTGNYVAEGFCSKNSLHDSYSTMISRGAVVPRIHAATHNGRLDGRPVFFSEKYWSDKLRNSSRSILASQQLQNPMADEAATFQTQWLKSYDVRPRTMNVYIMGDPSRGKGATSDNTAFAVIGVSATGAKFLLDGYCHRMTLSQRWMAMRTLYHRWSEMNGVAHVAVGYERYGQQSDDEYFQEQMELEARRRIPNAHFPIDELAWPREGGGSKRERVERLEPDLRNGRFFLPAPVLHDAKPRTWRVVTDPALRDFGAIEYNDNLGLSAAQMDVLAGGSPDLMAKAIICRDPDLVAARAGGGRYDLTVRFLEELQSFPFGLHDDLLDAASRVYDMDCCPPMAPSSRHVDVRVYSDGV